MRSVGGWVQLVRKVLELPASTETAAGNHQKSCRSNESANTFRAAQHGLKFGTHFPPEVIGDFIVFGTNIP
jgi:hypothetical protein